MHMIAIYIHLSLSLSLISLSLSLISLSLSGRKWSMTDVVYRVCWIVRGIWYIVYDVMDGVWYVGHSIRHVLYSTYYMACCMICVIRDIWRDTKCDTWRVTCLKTRVRCVRIHTASCVSVDTCCNFMVVSDIRCLMSDVWYAVCFILQGAWYVSKVCLTY